MPKSEGSFRFQQLRGVALHVGKLLALWIFQPWSVFSLALILVLPPPPLLGNIFFFLKEKTILEDEDAKINNSKIQQFIYLFIFTEIYPLGLT